MYVGKAYNTNPTSTYPPYYASQRKAIPSVFVICVSGAGSFGELQLHVWTPLVQGLNLGYTVKYNSLP